MIILLIYLLVSMKLEMYINRLFVSSFNIMFQCVVLRNSLKYYTERQFK